MLEAFWGLNGTPFGKSIKPDQLFISNAVKELVSRLDYFIEHQLKLKGCQNSPFSDNAIEAIFKNTAGIPRLIAALAFHTMTLGMMQKTNILTKEQVFQAAHEL